MPQDRCERLRKEVREWEDLGDQQVLCGNNSAADAAYALADQKQRESLWTFPVF